MPQLIKMINFFGEYLQGDYFEKSLKSLYPCHQIIETEEQQGFSFTSIMILCSIVASIETWGEQTRSYFWRHSAVVYHKLSHVSSWILTLDFTWNCYGLQEAKNFSRNSGHFKCVTKETRCQVSIAELLTQNL